MADGDKTFTEAEHIAILTDRVAKETAELTTSNATLSTEKSDLQNKLDIAESAKVAAEQAKETAEKDLADFKAGIEALAVAEGKRDDRLKAVKEVAAHLGDEFLTDEDRVKRIVAMDDDSFLGYVADLKATAPVGASTAAAPRETAMAGAASTATGGAATTSAGRAFLLGRYVPKGD